ncbi:hypothetical protein AT575_03410 [Streptococcus penaeicida]|uniref:FAD:protein FMN transferase n=1 Tax=Streptococcus penaeicida TaxID=1765960 RepID=A0A2N8LCR1_9STRE|nr:FAD:protein FMN transferase [Streptococcus penaeicida]PND47944.1 hypothetical protein AT575_03410 [Streptococcus penaeicida]
MSSYQKNYHTFQAMNLPFTLTMVSNDLEKAILLMEDIKPAIEAELERIEQTYSPFLEDSLVSQFAAGKDEILLENREFYQVYASCAAAEVKTKGYFTPYYNDSYNPTGYAKGWTVEKIFKEVIKPLLAHDFMIAVSFNGGGDMQFASREASDFEWQIAVENPDDRQKIVATYHLANGAMATSGFSKRGQHSQQALHSGVKQVTIISDSLAVADVWATVGLVASESDFTEFITKEGLSGLICHQEGLIIFNKGEIHYA